MGIIEPIEDKIMHALYKAHANELDMRFIESLKALFGEREIEITIREIPAKEEVFSPLSETLIIEYADPSEPPIVTEVSTINAQP
ncbi:hypothetical protein U14_01186 [Candidatus Moduliflexus flocculans]|uniref:Uncharacterized protein n=1 Tax=Candidatus Moduliflexus flocculans TaxID=1499966 RepID=A0A0S6VW53_9BACT|nr:hypothetical protein U14_01186 [Candidatus Moduliflexus flocculans]